ncbi:hypothetical protein AZ78_0941 [Lysobacter capsici AZ78]|uniref:Uncharacterized protein n=1 Tax=Lysobacter capsici AZ78 TaxID=1444315 RepID=A0A120AFR3_9GAMM|nr:hypothetical protein [Lysobacter capsici]KWS03395.1 hypothetical protein AZ78_0941 [Lysobacter capsici AZ78]
MNKKSLLLVLAGLLVFVIGGWLKFSGGPADADIAVVEKCRAEMDKRNADAAMRDKCEEAAFAHAVTATDAASAARAISAANENEIGGNGLAMFLLGLGAALTVGGVLVGRRRG